MVNTYVMRNIDTVKAEEAHKEYDLIKWKLQSWKSPTSLLLLIPFFFFSLASYSLGSIEICAFN